jgi:hypothetical protein
MRDVDWVITCMDSDKFRLMLQWLPETPWFRLRRIELVTHRQRPEIVEICSKYARVLRPLWPIRCRTDQLECDYLDRIDAPEALRVYFRDLLGVKLMLPLTNDMPMMFTDDDVVVTTDPMYLWGPSAWGSQSGLDAYTDTAKDVSSLGALAHAFNMPIGLSDFNATRTDAGVWYLPNINRIDYADRLRRYFSHPLTVQVSQDTGVANGDHTQRFRKLDQRFLSGYMIYSGGLPLRGPHYRALADKNPPKTVPQATFLHYCASGRKEAYMRWLDEECVG